MPKCTQSALLALSLCLTACGDDAPQVTPSPTPSPAQGTATPSPTPTLPEPSFTIDLAERENTTFIRNTIDIEGEAPGVYESLVLTNLPGFEVDVAQAAESYQRFVLILSEAFPDAPSPDNCQVLFESTQTLATLFAPHVGPDRYLLLIPGEASNGHYTFKEGSTLAAGEDSPPESGTLAGGLLSLEANPWQPIVDTFDMEACAAGDDFWDSEAVDDAYQEWVIQEGQMTITEHNEDAMAVSFSELVIAGSGDDGSRVAGIITEGEVSAPVTLVTTSIEPD